MCVSVELTNDIWTVFLLIMRSCLSEIVTLVSYVRLASYFCLTLSVVNQRSSHECPRIMRKFGCAAFRSPLVYIMNVSSAADPVSSRLTVFISLRVRHHQIFCCYCFLPFCIVDPVNKKGHFFILSVPKFTANLYCICFCINL